MTLTQSDTTTLAMPEGWLIDDLGRARLQRLLADQPADVAAVAPTSGPIPPGSSYRVHAERLAARPLLSSDRCETAVPAALVRSGFDYAERDGGFVVNGPVIVDAGAHAYDPWAEPTDSPAPADPVGRSPFSRRPTVVLLQCQTNPEEDLADWARRLTNGLMRHDIEARLAMFDVSPGLHLTRPCAPVEATIQALRPDVIITLDEAAADMAPQWCRESRSTLLVELAIDPSVTIELVSWRIGHDAGRLRARIGQSVDTRPLARLVNRLCSGPQPVPPPRDTPAGPTAVQLRTAPPAETTLALVTPDGGSLSRRLEAFASHADVLTTTTHLAAEAEDDDVVVIDAAVHPDLAIEIVERRRAQHRSTIADVSHAPLGDAEWRVLEACRHATTSSLGLRSQLRDRGIHAQLLPTLLAPSALVRLDAARVLDPPEPATTIGVVAEPGQESRADDLVTRLRIAHPNLAVLDPAPDHAGLGAVSSWRTMIWLGSSDSLATGRPRPVIESCLLGIPVVFARDDAPDLSDPVLTRHAVAASADLDEWLVAVAGLLDPSAPSRRRVSSRADALFGRKASASLCRRLIGWATYRGSVS